MDIPDLRSLSIKEEEKEKQVEGDEKIGLRNEAPDKQIPGIKLVFIQGKSI